MAIVYRVEQSEGKQMGNGVYRCQMGSAGNTLSEGYGMNHPLPSDDPKLNRELIERVGDEDGHYYFPQEFIFGFDSMESLVRWFTGLRKIDVIKKVEGYGIRIVAYRTDDVMVGTFQVCFNEETAEHIEAYPLDYFL